MTDNKPKVGIVLGTGASDLHFAAALIGKEAGQRTIDDPISLPPTQEGPRGKAWAIDLDAARATLKVAPEADATVAGWIVEAPWAHPAWHSYLIVLLHLRPLADARPTIFHLEGATHELLVMALNPESPREPMITGKARTNWLEPANFAAQIIEPSDGAARDRIINAVQLIVDGKLSPDTDFIWQWSLLFGNNMVRK